FFNGCKKKRSNSALNAIVALDGKSAITLLPIQNQSNFEEPIAYNVVYCASDKQGEAVMASEILEFAVRKEYNALGFDGSKLVYNNKSKALTGLRSEIAHPKMNISKICSVKGPNINALTFAGTVATPPQSPEDFYVRQILWLAARGKWTKSGAKDFSPAFYHFLRESLSAVLDPRLGDVERIARIERFDTLYNPCADKDAQAKFQKERETNFDCKDGHYQIKATALEGYKDLDLITEALGKYREDNGLRALIAATFGVVVPEAESRSSSLALDGDVTSSFASAKSNKNSLTGFVDATPSIASAGQAKQSASDILKNASVQGASLYSKPVVLTPAEPKKPIVSTTTQDSLKQQLEGAKFYEGYKEGKSKEELAKNLKCPPWIENFGNGNMSNNPDCINWDKPKASGNTATSADNQQATAKSDDAKSQALKTENEAFCNKCRDKSGVCSDNGNAKWPVTYCVCTTAFGQNRKLLHKDTIDNYSNCSAYLQQLYLQDRSWAAEEQEAKKIAENALKRKADAAAKLASEKDEQKKKQLEEDINAEKNLADMSGMVLGQIKQPEKYDSTPKRDTISPPPGGVIAIKDAKGNTVITPGPVSATPAEPESPSESEVSNCKSKGATVDLRIKAKRDGKWSFSDCDCGDRDGKKFTIPASSQGTCDEIYAKVKGKPRLEVANVAPNKKLEKTGDQICKEKGGNYQGSVCDCGTDDSPLKVYVNVTSSESCKSAISAKNAEIATCKSNGGAWTRNSETGKFRCVCEGMGMAWAVDGKCKNVVSGFFAEDPNAKPESDPNGFREEFSPPPLNEDENKENDVSWADSFRNLWRTTPKEQADSEKIDSMIYDIATGEKNADSIMNDLTEGMRFQPPE
ncbi:MAG: hypothetical protein NT027_10645, partial [Proteobacteria bacterium]|nr:hypothetical protein [Pseudomonadota bacterium]